MSEFQQPQQPPMDPKQAKAQAKADKAYRKASRPFYKKPWFIVLAVIAVIVVIATATSGGDSSSDAESDTPTFPSASSAAESSAAAAPAGPSFAGQQDGDVSANAGETIDLDGVTLTSTVLVEGEALGSGSVFCSTITMQNGTDEAVNFGSYDWSLQDPNGAIRDVTFTASESLLDSGDLAAGGNVSGDVCFEADAALAGTYVVFYEPTFAFSSDRAAWVNVR